LYLTEENKEFLQVWRIKEIVKKYSDHIPYKIYLKIGDKEEQINSAKALWRMNKSEIKEEEYKEFYKTLSHGDDEPLTYLHNKVEGGQEFTTLFYIPKTAPMDLYRADYQSHVKLYVKRVFITDDDKELLFKTFAATTRCTSSNFFPYIKPTVLSVWS